MQKKKVKIPNDWIKGFTYKFSTAFNRAEMLEVEELSKKIYEKVKDSSDYYDGIDIIDDTKCEYFVRNGVKITRMGDKYMVLHTYTEPYMRVADRWFLRLMLNFFSPDESSNT